MPLPAPLAALPLLLAASPVPSQPFPMGGAGMPARAPGNLDLLLDPTAADLTLPIQVETFDPVGRARLIAERMPRSWNGSYQAYDGTPPVPVELTIERVRPLGQMVDLRGRMTVAGVATPVQGNLNAKSDQLDLLLLGDTLGGGLNVGGEFKGLQGLSLNGWNANRLTNPGGRLKLAPGPAKVPAAGPAAGQPVRGLW